MFGMLKTTKSIFTASAIVAWSILTIAPAARADVVPAAQAQSLPTPLTLQDAVSIALHKQPQTYIASSQVQQADALKQYEQSKYLPTVTPTFNYLLQSRSESHVSSNPLNSNTSSTFSGGQGGIVVQENLFDNGQREVANAQARRTLDADQQNARNVDQQTILTVTQDYYGLLKAMDLVRVSNLQIARAQQEIALVQAEIQAGTTAAADIYQPKSDLATAQISLSQNQTAVSTQASALKNAMGIISNFPIQPAPLTGAPAPEASPAPDVAAQTTAPTASPTGQPSAATSAPEAAPSGLSQLPTIPTVPAAKSIDAYFATAVDSRPDLKQQQQLVEVQKLNVKQAQLNSGVAVTGSYDYTYFNNAAVEPKGSDSTLMLTATFPLFDGGGSHDLVKAAQAQLDAAVNQYELQRQAVRTQIEQDAASRAGALAQTRLAQAAVDAAQETFDSEVAQRENGLATIFDVTTAEVTLTQAQDQYVTSLYTFYSDDAALQRDLGVNDTSPSGI